MPLNTLYVWVEGADDERFVDTVLRAELERLYGWVQVVPYAAMKKEKITKFLESIRAMEDAGYVFLADKDRSPCISAKKEELIGSIKVASNRSHCHCSKGDRVLVLSWLDGNRSAVTSHSCT